MKLYFKDRPTYKLNCRTLPFKHGFPKRADYCKTECVEFIREKICRGSCELCSAFRIVGI